MKVAVIGGGTAGLIGAVLCAREGFSVTVYEKADRCGRKLLASGNGQCNIDNENVTLANYYGKNRNFAKFALQMFDTMQNQLFWESIGVSLITKEKGKMYPRSLQAAAVLDLLRYACQNLNVTEKIGTEMIEIKKKENGFVLFDQLGNRYYADKVIVATGGSASSGLGGSESGYQLLKKMGHTLNKPLPAIVQLKTEQPNKALSGQKINGIVTLLVENKKIRTEEGEILFTDYGLSGVPILLVSAQGAMALEQHKNVTVMVDMVPDMTIDELESYLQMRKELMENVTLENFLSGFLPKRIAQQSIKEALGITLSATAKSLTSEDIGKIAVLLKEKTYKIIDTAGLKNAQATLGGISTDDFNPETMESYLLPGVFVVGEALDICGDCGGYNIHWATSSVQLAVKTIVEESRW